MHLKVDNYEPKTARRATESYANYRLGNYISIHALREESDVDAKVLDYVKEIFQSTLSARRATHISLS